MQHYTRGQALSQIRNLHTKDQPEHALNLWSWGPLKNHLLAAPLGKGYKGVPRTVGTIVQASLISQLYNFDLVMAKNLPEKAIMWAKEEDIEQAEACPVILCHALDQVEEEDHLYLLGPLPLPYHGSYAFVAEGENLVLYFIENLPAEARAKHNQVRQKIIDLADLARPEDIEHMWTPATALHKSIANEQVFQAYQQEAVSHILKTRDVERQEWESKLNFILEAHNTVMAIDRLLEHPEYQTRFQEIAHMMQDLAADYYAFHLAQTSRQAAPTAIPMSPAAQAVTKSIGMRIVIGEEKEESRLQTYPLPSLTSLHQTHLPSVEHFRGLAQSFGTRVAQSLWNTEESKEQLLEAPNGARLAVRGENEHEQRALHQLIGGGMGVEGIKYMVVMLAAYHAQTHGVDRKTDARVTLRQLLQFMGREDHADDLDEQQKLMRYILFMARTWVTAPDKEQVVKRRGRPRTIKREYTPLIVLEALSADERGGIRIPDAIEFHLGKEFWDQMFGTHKHFFTVPTTLILGYHSKDQAQEICLAFYLANMLNLNAGSFSIHFPTLLLQTGLQDQLDIDKGENRTRAAIRVLFALEQLEKDHLIERDPHPDVDTALAIAYYAGETAYTLNGIKANRLAEKTIKRIENAYRHLSILRPAEMRSKKRTSLQSLLARVEHNSITFKSGALINTQIEKRKAGRQAAIESRERAQEAAQRRQSNGKKRG